jgi:hypothetical protein
MYVDSALFTKGFEKLLNVWKFECSGMLDRIMGGGKFNFWPEKLDYLNPPEFYNWLACVLTCVDAYCLIKATYWWIFYGAEGMKKFYLALIFS